MARLQELGPFHRLASDTQTNEVARAITLSHELWGRAPFGSMQPQVQAWTGPLPEGRAGIEFMTTVLPTPGTPPHEARWRPGSPGVRLEGDFAKIAVRVVRNTQL